MRKRWSRHFLVLRSRCCLVGAFVFDRSTWLLQCAPVLNFLSMTWFLWVGFYNFYLGVALFAVAVGFYIRNSHFDLSWRKATALKLFADRNFLSRRS